MVYAGIKNVYNSKLSWLILIYIFGILLSYAMQEKIIHTPENLQSDFEDLANNPEKYVDFDLDDTLYTDATGFYRLLPYYQKVNTKGINYLIQWNPLENRWQLMNTEVLDSFQILHRQLEVDEIKRRKESFSCDTLQNYKFNLMKLKETNTKLQKEVDKTKKELNSANQKYNTLQENLTPIVEKNEQLTKKVLKGPFKKNNIENEQNEISKSAPYYNNRPHQRKILNENLNQYTEDFPEIKDESEEFNKANVQNQQYKISKTVKFHEIFLEQYKEKFNKLQIKREENTNEYYNSQIENLTPIMEKLVVKDSFQPDVQNAKNEILKSSQKHELWFQEYKKKFDQLKNQRETNEKEFKEKNKFSSIENKTDEKLKLSFNENDIEAKERFTEKTIKTDTLLSQFQNEKIHLKNETKKDLSVKQNNFTTDVFSSANHKMKKSKPLLILQEYQINTHEEELKRTKIELEKIRKLNKEIQKQNINLVETKYKLIGIINATDVSVGTNQEMKKGKPFLVQENQINTHEEELKQTKIELKAIRTFNKEIQKQNINLAKEKYKLLEIITKNVSQN